MEHEREAQFIDFNEYFPFYITDSHCRNPK
jgi:hypothetical protein